MQKILRFVDAHLPWFVLLMVALGLTFSSVFSALMGFLSFFMAIMTFSSTLGSGFRDLAGAFRRPVPVAATLLILHLLMPVVTLFLGKALFPEAPLFTTGLVLEYTIPTAVTSLMWVGICNADMPLAISIVLLDTLLSPIVIPVTLKALLGSVVELDSLGMLQDLVWMVAIPSVAAMALYQVRPETARALKPKLSPLSRLVMFLLIAANAGGCAPFLEELDITLVKVMAAVFLLCLLGFFFGYWAAKLLKLEYPARFTICFCAGMRNISAGAVLASQYFPPEVLFPVAFSPVFWQIIASVVAKLLQSTPSAKAHANALAEK